MRKTLAALLGAGLFWGPAFAEDAPKGNPCHGISDRVSRVVCYDKATGYMEPEAPLATEEEGPKAQPQADTSKGRQWHLSVEESALDARTDVWLSVQSTNTQPNQIGRPEYAGLTLRCMNNSTNLFITFNSYTSDAQNLRYKIDQGKVQKVWMQTMNGGDGIGLWSGAKAIPFAKALFEKERLVVAYESYSNANLEFTFDVAGLADRVRPLAESCGW